MPGKTMKTLTWGGSLAVLTALAGTTALAQTSGTVIVPAPALQAEPSVGAVTESDIPILEQIDNDQAIAETLIAQGFTDVHILRQGALMTVTAQRAGVPIELVYSVANGSLVSIDGQNLRPEGEDSSAGDRPQSRPDRGTDATDEDSASPDTDDGAADEGSEDTSDDAQADGTADSEGGADDGATGHDGSDAGGDGAAGSDGADSDAGSDSGSDTGADGGADGGSDSGSDSGSDGGDSGSGDGSDSGGDGNGGDGDGGTSG